MKRSAQAHWQGNLAEGQGRLSTQSGALNDNRYSFKGRFEDETPSVTNPEELIAAAHAGCFAMQLSHFLAENGTPAEDLDATAVVEVKPGQGILSSALTLKAKVPEIDDETFQSLAGKAKDECPVSNALGSITITLDASLV